MVICLLQFLLNKEKKMLRILNKYMRGVLKMNMDKIYSCIIKGENFKLIEQDSIEFKCPKCRENLFQSSLKHGKIECKSSQEYLYDDGDTINVSEENLLKTDTEMMFGYCENCNQQISGIHLVVLDKNLDNKDLEDSFSNMFVIYDSGNMISSFDHLKQYGVCIDNTIIGNVLVYKNAIINKNSVYGLLKDVRRNISIIYLHCLSSDIDLNSNGIGVCNCKDDSDIWEKASAIVENLINSTEYLIED